MSTNHGNRPRLKPAEIVAAYEDLNATEVAALVGVSENTVLRVLRRADAVRPPGNRAPWWLQMAKRLRASGWSYRAIAEHASTESTVTAWTVCRSLKRSEKRRRA